MFLKGKVNSSSTAVSLHITCSGKRLDVFTRTSKKILGQYHDQYKQNLILVRLRNLSETVTKSYLFSPLEDHHGFYLYKSLSPNDDARRAIERLLGYLETEIKFEDKEGKLVTAVFNFGGIVELYSSLRKACRLGQSLALVNPRLIARDQNLEKVKGSGFSFEKLDLLSRSAPSKPRIGSEPSSISGTTSVFGLSMGLQLEDLTTRMKVELVPLKDNPELYLLSRVPDSNPDFEFYLALIPKTTGLCEVRAVGHTVHTNPQRSSIRNAFHNNVSYLQKIFGPYKLFETMPNNVEIEPGSWMAALKSGNIRLMAEWSEKTKSRLGIDLERVALTIRAESEESARLILQITFSNSLAGKPLEK